MIFNVITKGIQDMRCLFFFSIKHFHFSGTGLKHIPRYTWTFDLGVCDDRPQGILLLSLTPDPPPYQNPFHKMPDHVILSKSVMPLDCQGTR